MIKWLNNVDWGEVCLITYLMLVGIFAYGLGYKRAKSDIEEEWRQTNANNR